MIRSSASDQGLNIGQENVNMTYLYGLGDFFSVMFEDTSVTNLLMEADTVVASEIYSRFLQLTSTQSLEDIQTTLGTQIQLVLVSSTDLVPGSVSEYRLDKSYSSARYVANRPLLPTETLEASIDFSISQKVDGSSTIRFAKPLDEYAISSRLLKDGETKQYALWLTDAQVDERLISTYYGNLISLSPQNSTEQFANFVYGLYYVYVQGPSLSTLKKGLNLALGIPLSRLNETVIDIRAYLQTDQFIVVTDQNQYLLPFGLQPTVSVGDQLSVGDEIASWVELKDWVNDGEWWINMYIPSNVVPTVPPGQNTRYATVGSELDYVMRNYLKTHTFLVNVNVTTFKNNQQFSQLFDIVKRAKPAYTQPIYVWSVKSDEVADFFEHLTFLLTSNYEEDVGGGYRHMRRGELVRPLSRGRSRYVRSSGPACAKNPLGEDTLLNSSMNTLQGVEVQGYANTVSSYRSNTDTEARWLDILANRSSQTWHRKRGQLGFRRGVSVVDDLMQPVPFYNVPSPKVVHETVCLYELYPSIPEGSRVVPLCVVTKSELTLKCGLFNLPEPVLSKGYYIVRGNWSTDVVNDLAVNHDTSSQFVADFYPELFRRDSDLPPTMLVNDYMKAQFLPAKELLTTSDALIAFPITCDVLSLCLVSFNPDLEYPSFLPAEDDLDSATLEITAPAMRGMAPHGSAFYQSRGNLAYRVTSDVLPEPSVDASAALANFLFSSSVPDMSRIVPLTVISRAELSLKCGMWDVPVPSKYISFFLFSGNFRSDAVNVRDINSIDASTLVPIPLSGQVAQGLSVLTANPLYPDFYRRDSDVPDYRDLHRNTLFEFTPPASEIQNTDFLLGVNLSHNAVALYWISTAATTSATEFWRLRSSPNRLTRVGTGQPDIDGKVVVAPFINVEVTGYNSYDTGINTGAVNSAISGRSVEFFYTDAMNTNVPATRGGVPLKHVIQL